MATGSTTDSGPFISTAALLDHWQGHRRLTRRVIEAFPEDQLFTFSLGGMRPFGDIGKELLAMAAPMVRGLATGEWVYSPPEAGSRADLLRLWDESTREMNELWPRIPAGRFAETLTAFDQYTGAGHWLVLYVVDNEIHHRGQG